MPIFHGFKVVFLNTLEKLLYVQLLASVKEVDFLSYIIFLLRSSVCIAADRSFG